MSEIHDPATPLQPATEARLMTHSYDGIREYDNPLPGWWSMIFAGSIAFAAAYFFYYNVANRGSTPADDYRHSLAEYESKRALRDEAEAANVTEALLAEAVKDPKVLTHGAEIFASRCVSCHTADGHGLIGPNLTDDYQIHGTTRLDIYRTVRNGGAQGTAMPAWGEQLAAADVLAAAVFVTTLRGMNIPGKPPEGHKIEAFPR